MLLRSSSVRVFSRVQELGLTRFKGPGTKKISWVRMKGLINEHPCSGESPEGLPRQAGLLQGDFPPPSLSVLHLTHAASCLLVFTQVDFLESSFLINI